MRNVRTLAEKETVCVTCFYISVFYEINKTGLIYSKSKNLPKKRKTVNQNKKIKPVCTMVIWDLIIA
jgi:hypothetical protein